MIRRESSDWPHVLTPAPGCYPPAAPLRTNERVLHLAIYPHEPHARLALDTIATDYRMIYWPDARATLTDTACALAQEIRPTVVFMQLQQGGVLEPHQVDAIRALCAPECVFIQWDGDQHHAPADPQRRWFVELGRVCDVSLVVNTSHPAEYAALGVRGAGFFEIAIDPTVFHPTAPTSGVPPVVLLASHYGARMHTRRSAMILELAQHLGERFGVYGYNWEGMPFGRPLLAQHHEAGVYAAAQAALSISIVNDLPRYTSDRLFRMLGSGAVCLVERFPDCEGLGLVDGVNCALWSGLDGLRAAVDAALELDDAKRLAMRDAAAALGREHTWNARMPELLAIVDAVRAARVSSQAGCG
jgi:hypothetical protein